MCALRSIRKRAREENGATLLTLSGATPAKRPKPSCTDPGSFCNMKWMTPEQTAARKLAAAESAAAKKLAGRDKVIKTLRAENRSLKQQVAELLPQIKALRERSDAKGWCASDEFIDLSKGDHCLYAKVMKHPEVLKKLRGGGATHGF
eukprot:SAG25_NODE_6685_length_538_cov_1.059226_1_plen_147_part_10